MTQGERISDEQDGGATIVEPVAFRGDSNPVAIEDKRDAPLVGAEGEVPPEVRTVGPASLWIEPSDGVLARLPSRPERVVRESAVELESAQEETQNQDIREKNQGSPSKPQLAQELNPAPERPKRVRDV